MERREEEREEERSETNTRRRNATLPFSPFTRLQRVVHSAAQSLDRIDARSPSLLASFSTLFSFFFESSSYNVAGSHRRTERCCRWSLNRSERVVRRSETFEAVAELRPCFFSLSPGHLPHFPLPVSFHHLTRPPQTVETSSRDRHPSFHRPRVSSSRCDFSSPFSSFALKLTPVPISR
jgi:hypothetical protein